MKSIQVICLFAVLSHFSPALSQSKYEVVQQRMQQMVQRNPNRVSKFQLAVSEDGSSVEGLKILGRGEALNQLVVATHHGDEWGAPEIALAFAQDLIANPLVDRTVYVIPVMMPDSYNARTRDYKGVNPNRDYPGPCGSHDGDIRLKPFTLRATKALADFVREKNIITTIEVHNPWGTVHYPWSDHENSYTHDHNTFVSLLETAYRGSSYTHSTVPDKFYTMRGAFTDYLFWQYGIWAYLVEVGPNKNPDERTLGLEIAVHMPAFRSLLLNSPVLRSPNNSHPGCMDSFISGLTRIKFEE
jgi:carboxypeptidase T